MKMITAGNLELEETSTLEHLCLEEADGFGDVRICADWEIWVELARGILKAGRLWIVGRQRGSEPTEVMGLFSTEARAVEACRQDIDFVAPMDLDVEIQQEKTVWLEAYYPRAIENAKERTGK